VDTSFSLDSVGLPPIVPAPPETGSGPPSGDSAAEDLDRPGRDDADRSVLVVEDEADAREAIVELLQHEGYRAVGVEHGEAALALLDSGRRFSLILLDLVMPVMDGWGFCEAIGSDPRHANIPVAIITANASQDRLPRRRNDAGLFVKPIQVDRLLKLVARICG